MDSGDAGGISRRNETWGALAIVLLAAALRIAFLGHEVVGGDEVHSLRVLKGNSLGYILTHFHKPDNCIPLTAWSWLLASTVGLEEWGFRLPSWLSGVLLVALVAYASRDHLTPGERLLLMFVLACSPLLVYWSREARPYSAITLLGALSVVTLVRYAAKRSRSWLILGALCQFGLFAFSPTTAPFLAGLAVAAWVVGWRAGRGCPLRQRILAASSMLAPGLLALALLALLLGPALPTLVAEMEGEGATLTRVEPSTLLHSLRLLYGLPQLAYDDPLRLLPIAPLLLTLWGVVSLVRRRPDSGIPVLIVLLLPAACYTWSGFHRIGSAMVFTRYQAALVPFFLALTVLGFGDLARRAAARRPRFGSGPLLTAFGLVALLTVRGPLASGLPPRSPSGLRLSRLFRASPIGEWRDPARAPRLYHDLAERAPGVVVEWPNSPREGTSYAFYQTIHRGRVIRCSRVDVTARGPGVDARRWRLRTFAWEDTALHGRLPTGAVVVLHLRPDAERAFFDTGRDRELTPLARSAKAALKTCRTSMGPPFYEDEWVAAFRAP